MSLKNLLLLIILVIFALISNACKGQIQQESPTPDVPQSEQTKIAFEWNNKIFSVNIDGSNLMNLTPDKNTVDRLPVWSPDGSKLALLTKPSGQTQEEFCVMTVNDQKRIKFQLPTTNNLNFDKSHYFPLWSPKGDKLAFWYDGNIYVADSDGNNLHTVNNGKIAETRGNWWSPDSSKIVFVSRATSGSNWGSIYLVNSDGNNLVKLTPGRDDDGLPRWSPDGNKIAYLTVPFRQENPLTMHSELCIIGSDGKNQIGVTNPVEDAAGQVWSPDSSKIAFWYLNEGTTNLYSVNSDGSNLTKLTNFSNDLTPIFFGESNFSTFRAFAYQTLTQWSPDGSKILFMLPVSKYRWVVRVINSDGSNMINFTSDNFSDSNPVWSPDSSKIISASTFGGEAIHISIANYDGTNRQDVSKNIEPFKKEQAEGFMFDISIFPSGTTIPQPWIIERGTW
jgi:Tol biopolymer transport system component